MPTPTKPPEGLLDASEPDRAEVVLAGEVNPVDHLPKGTFQKIGSAMAALVFAVCASYFVPALANARPWKPGEPVPYWNLIGRYVLGEAAEVEEAAAEVDEAQAIARAVEDDDEAGPLVEAPVVAKVDAEEEAARPYEPRPEDEEPAKSPIEDPTGKALDPFFETLARTDQRIEGAVTRVAHYGDSAVGNDGITSAARRRMQRRFGDAGHGFHLLSPPNASYKHQGVRFETNAKWGKCFIIQKCRPDGHYGFGGVTFKSNGGAQSRFRTAKDGAFGRKMGRFELWYAGQPKGGRVQIKVDGGEPVVVETAADSLEDRWHAIELEDGPHDVVVRAIGGGKVRSYGVVMERDVPGVVWDGLSLIGAFTSRLAEQDPEHFSSQLRHRGSDLVVLMFGGNDMLRKMKMANYKEEYRRVLKLVRGASTPERPIACLVMAPLDHGERKGSRIVTQQIVPRMVQAQREVAHEEGCAFFDTFAAMGGEGSAGRWFRSSPRLMSGDLAHLTHRGHKVIGEHLFRALVQAYVAYRRRR